MNVTVSNKNNQNLRRRIGEEILWSNWSEKKKSTGDNICVEKLARETLSVGVKR